MICSGLSSTPACNHRPAHTLCALRQIEGSNHFSLGFNVTEWLRASINDCSRHPTDLCCPLPARKHVTYNTVMMRTLGITSIQQGKRARLLPTFMIMYSSLLCQMEKLAETQVYLRTNLKSKAREVVGSRSARANTLKVKMGSQNVELGKC